MPIAQFANTAFYTSFSPVFANSDAQKTNVRSNLPGTRYTRQDKADVAFALQEFLEPCSGVSIE